MKLKTVLFAIVLVPLVFSATVCGFLIVELTNSERKFEQQQKVRKALSASSAYLSQMLESMALLSALERNSQPAVALAQDSYRSTSRRAFASLDTWRELLPEGGSLDFLSDRTAEFNTLANKVFAASAARKLSRMQTTLVSYELLTRGNDLLSLCSKLQQQLIENSKPYLVRGQAAGFNVALPAMLLVAVLTAAAAIIIRRGLSARLSVLLHNARSFAELKLFSPPLSGSDEISEVDSAFRQMANAIITYRKYEKLLIENAHDLLCSLDADFVFTSISPSCKTLWHQSQEQFIGRSISDVLPALMSRAIGEGLMTARRTGSISQFSLNSEIDDRLRHFLCTASWNENQLIYSLTVTDETAAWERREAIRQSEQRTRTLLAGMPAVVFLISADGTIQFANPAAEEIFGSVAGRNLSELLVFDSQSRLDDAMRYAAGRSVECILKEGTANQRRAQLTLESVQISGNNAWLAIISNTDERSAIAQLRQAMISIVSHDLRTPLTAVRSSLELTLYESGQTPELAEPLRETIREVDQLNELFTQLLSIQRYGQKEPSLDSLKAVDVAVILDESIDIVGEASITKGVDIVHDLERTTIPADAECLQQIFVRLLNMLVSDCASGSVIEISALREPEALELVFTCKGKLLESTQRFSAAIIEVLAGNIRASVSTTEKGVILKLPKLAE